MVHEAVRVAPLRGSREGDVDLELGLPLATQCAEAREPELGEQVHDDLLRPHRLQVLALQEGVL